MREIIHKLACLHSNKIAFVAINCFNPNGECRKSFNLAKYPQILLQIRDVGLLQYNGPVDFNYITNYLKLIQQPLNRIDDIGEFIQYVLVNDVIYLDFFINNFKNFNYFEFKGTIVGHFDLSNDGDDKLFKIFYQSSLSSINISKNNHFINIKLFYIFLTLIL